MNFSKKIQSVVAEARKIKESLSVHTDGDYGTERGYRNVHERGAHWGEMVAEMGEFMADVYEGKRPIWHLREAMTVSDFPLLFGDLLYRQLQGNYRAWPTTVNKWARVHTLNDFRALNLYTIDGGNGELSQVAERAPYPETTFTEGTKSIQVYKYGRRYSISFEMLINDDLNAFQTRPQQLAAAVRNSEERAGAKLLADASGPHASFFVADADGNGNPNIVTSNPALSIDGLQTAYTMLHSFLDPQGEPIMVPGVILMVGPDLEITAQNIMNAINLDVRTTTQGGNTGTFLRVSNWMRGRVTLIVNPFLPLIATSNPTGNWFLIASPAEGRPAFHFARLRGHESPELFIKDSDQRQLGGGVVDPLQGSFGNDDIDYKVRAFFGTLQGDKLGAVASNGSGS